MDISAQAAVIGGQRFDALCACQAARLSTSTDVAPTDGSMAARSSLKFLATWEGLHSYYVVSPAPPKLLSWADCRAACNSSAAALRYGRMLSYGSEQERLFVLAVLAAYTRANGGGARRVCLDAPNMTAWLEGNDVGLGCKWTQSCILRYRVD